MAEQTSSPSVILCKMCGKKEVDSSVKPNCRDCHEVHVKGPYYRSLLNKMNEIEGIESLISRGKKATYGEYCCEILSGHLCETTNVCTLEKKRYLIFPLTVEDK